MNPAEQRLALRDAAHWHARLGAAPDCTQTRQQWQTWHQQNTLHQWAWQRLERLQAELHGLPGPLARRAMSSSVQATRRTLLKGLVLGLGTCGLAWTGYRNTPIWLADQRTATGERRELDLPDGTRLTLNTASAVDIRFTAEQRLIVLHAGEILVETGADSRPFKVRSAHAEMRALGTRFAVRQFDDHTALSVLEHAVAVRNAANATEVRVDAGMGLDIADGALPAPRPIDASQSAWSHGRLVIDNWRLDRTLAELQRYRRGFIHCSDAIAGLRLSGAYPLDDTDRALAAITQALPVRLESRTRYWVRVLPRG